jgi:hypothetical protein
MLAARAMLVPRALFVPSAALVASRGGAIKLPDMVITVAAELAADHPRPLLRLRPPLVVMPASVQQRWGVVWLMPLRRTGGTEPLVPLRTPQRMSGTTVLLQSLVERER